MSGQLHHNLMKVEKRLSHLGFYLDGLPETKDEKKKGLFDAGIALMAKHEYAKAIDFFRNCLRLRLTGSEKSALLLLIGNCFCSYPRHNMSQPPHWKEARTVWEEALTCARQAGDEPAGAAALNNLGLAYDTPSERDKAFQFFTKSLEIKQNIGDEPGIAQTYTNMGDLFRFEQSKAIPFYKRALDIFQENGDSAGAGRACQALAYMYGLSYEFDVAVTFWEKYLGMAESAGDLLGVARAKGGMGYLRHRQGRKEESERLLREVVEIRTRKRITR